MGICGRTGAGKSTILNLLFRLVDPCDGNILLDGGDISHTSLTKLRNSLTLIPQNPILFKGTVAFNLCPTHNHNSNPTLLWEALDAVNLSDFVKANGGLDKFLIEAEGANLSQGQRQLFSLARAIVRKRPILILDEPTSNVDKEADQLIRGLMQTDVFGENVTTITVAHRISSIKDSDLIVVMDKGVVAQTGTPEELQTKGSINF